MRTVKRMLVLTAAAAALVIPATSGAQTPAAQGSATGTGGTGPVAATSGQGSGQQEPRLTIRHFCQTHGGFGAYLAMRATGFPPNSEGEFRIVLLETNFYSTDPTDARGALDWSIGWGLAGLDDPLVGRPVEVRLEVAGVSVTETVTLTCDPFLLYIPWLSVHKRG
jgi:hypothetical protein